jgi:hypothetical protein
LTSSAMRLSPFLRSRMRDRSVTGRDRQRDTPGRVSAGCLPVATDGREETPATG